ncbi:hypothetical protein ACOSQ2_021157 [Xanthoceras sorbifolium]
MQNLSANFSSNNSTFNKSSDNRGGNSNNYRGNRSRGREGKYPSKSHQRIHCQLCFKSVMEHSNAIGVLTSNFKDLLLLLKVISKLLFLSKLKALMMQDKDLAQMEIR